jgi:hypothetical protein
MCFIVAIILLAGDQSTSKAERGRLILKDYRSVVLAKERGVANDGIVNRLEAKK